MPTPGAADLAVQRRPCRRRGVRRAGPPYIHTACTAAALLFSSTHYTMLRAGIGLYGMWPSRETLVSAREKSGAVPDFHPVLTWKTRLVQVKTVPEGSFVGYGCSYRTMRRTTLGVFPVGYADGYDRALGNRAHVLVRGRRRAGDRQDLHEPVHGRSHRRFRAPGWKTRWFSWEARVRKGGPPRLPAGHRERP